MLATWKHTAPVMKLLLALLVLALTCLANSETLTKRDRKPEGNGLNLVQDLSRELATLGPRLSMAADIGRKRKTNKKKRPSQSQKKKQRPNAKKTKYTCTQKLLQAKCITGIVKTIETIETRINSYVGRKRFDVFESEITARIEKVSADLASVMNSSLNLTSADSQSDNISSVLARIQNYAEVLNSTR